MYSRELGETPAKAGVSKAVWLDAGCQALSEGSKITIFTGSNALGPRSSGLFLRLVPLSLLAPVVIFDDIPRQRRGCGGRSPRTTIR